MDESWLAGAKFYPTNPAKRNHCQRNSHDSMRILWDFDTSELSFVLIEVRENSHSVGK
jgi:hypothetical protein